MKAVPVDAYALSAASALCRAARKDTGKIVHVNVAVYNEQDETIGLVSFSSPSTVFAHRTIMPDRHKGTVFVQIHGADLAKIDNWPIVDEDVDDIGIHVAYLKKGRGQGRARLLLPWGDSSVNMRVRKQTSELDINFAASKLSSTVKRARKQIHVGITGTRKGVSKKRIAKLQGLLRQVSVGRDLVLHHGDCVGADAQAHNVAVALGSHIVVHPPENNKLRSYRNHWRATFRDPKPYLARNKDIVNESEMLIGLPVDVNDEQYKGGTWSTIQYARKRGVKVVLV